MTKALCPYCHSDDITRDAKAEMNPKTGEWELHSTYDPFYCEACGDEFSSPDYIEKLEDHDIILKLTETCKCLIECLDTYKAIGTMHGWDVVLKNAKRTMKEVNE